MAFCHLWKQLFTLPHEVEHCGPETGDLFFVLWVTVVFTWEDTYQSYDGYSTPWHTNHMSCPLLHAAQCLCRCCRVMAAFWTQNWSTQSFCSSISIGKETSSPKACMHMSVQGLTLAEEQLVLLLEAGETAVQKYSEHQCSGFICGLWCMARWVSSWRLCGTRDWRWCK